jgi:hypothetical protein
MALTGRMSSNRPSSPLAEGMSRPEQGFETGRRRDGEYILGSGAFRIEGQLNLLITS